jgi:hypothetical protein
MDKRKALDIIDAMIKAESGSTDPLKALRDRIVSIQNSSVQPLMKAINDVETMLKKSSAMDLDMKEKSVKKAIPAPAPKPPMGKMPSPKMPAMPKMPGMKAPGAGMKVPMKSPGMGNKPPMAKVDPTTHLNGTLLDKNLSSGSMQSGDVGSNVQNMTPGLTKDQGSVGGAPSDAPPMMASEGKSHMHKHIAKCLDKCMTKSLAASEKVVKGDTVVPDSGFGKITIKDSEKSMTKSEVKKAGVMSTGPVQSPAMPKPANVSVKMGMGMGMGKSAANPDEKQDAKLGEGVEHMVENHMMANKPAEMKEGHPVASIIQHMHSRKPMMKSSPEKVFEGSQTAKEMGSEGKRAIEEPKDKPFKVQPDRPGQANKPVVKKGEVLNKPYHSEAQRRWAHTPTGEKSLGGKAAVHEWDTASKGKKLPEKVSKK